MKAGLINNTHTHRRLPALPPSFLPQVNDIAPAWHEEITFDNVPYPPSSKISITIVYRSGKKDEVLGVACPGSNLWTTGNNPPQVRVCVLEGGRHFQTGKGKDEPMTT
jgi:hypothetical protein